MTTISEQEATQQEARYIAENIQILPQLKQFIRPLSTDEFMQLEANILSEGIRDSLILWETNYLNYYILSGKLPEGYEPESEQEEYRKLCFILVDGHNRYTIASRHGIEFGFEVHRFDTIEDCKQFMLNVQLGRRNATPEELSYYRGLQYRNAKNAHGGNRASSQNDNLTDNKKTIEKVAEQHNVSPATIARDEKFFEGLEIIGKFRPDLKNEILSGVLKVSKSDIYNLVEANKQIELKEIHFKFGLNALFADLNRFINANLTKTAQAKEKDFWKKQAQAEKQANLFDAPQSEPEQEEPDFFNRGEEEKQDFESLYRQVFKEVEYYKERTEYFSSELEITEQKLADLQKDVKLPNLQARMKLVNAGIRILRKYSYKKHYISEFELEKSGANWTEIEHFYSKEELEQRVSELNQEENVIFEN